ncbi:hypothetical protein PHMEG_0007955 [Phytophthora megakarya]|uniref:CLASP N-terminal domain-containing protein n=1 Tax=Phytophthora megakarya TaxID=4795 RepID=A0A225WKD9_9STRA|nr:hypothetical protein PHMEG_0007955 [Phytophthora megakarya]
MLKLCALGIARKAKSSRTGGSSTRRRLTGSSAVTSMERLNRQVQETQRLLSNPETDWKDSSAAMEELATAVECLGQRVNRKDVVRLLLSLSVGIGMQLVSIRSKLVKDVCEALLRIVKVLGRDFQDMANAILPQIIATAKCSSAAIRQPGSKLMSKLSEAVRYDLSLLRKIYVQLMQDKAQVLVLEQLRIIFVYWSEAEVTPYESDILEIIRRGLEDQNEKVRKVAREVLTRLSSRWSERVDELVDIPSTQSKVLLISEHRDSPLAEAILNKYPELTNKTDSFARSRSFRTSFRKSPRHKREQDIEIHVSATPPPKSTGRESMTQQESSSETTRRTRKTVVAPESTERGISRRLFGNPEFSTEPDDQQDDKSEMSDDSQLLGYPPKPTKTEIGQRFAPNAREFPSSPSRTAVSRSSSIFNVEEASLQHSPVRQLKDTKIPSPSNRSRKRLEAPTRATSSPERSSMLPSCTMKGSGSSGPSSLLGSPKFEEKKTKINPFGASNEYFDKPISSSIETTTLPVSPTGNTRYADFKEERVETKPLSASDEYFSKPIPSSIGIPTPPPPSTDNVTLRPRRRTFSRQEYDDFPLAFPPDLQSSSGGELQPRQVETTPESVMHNSPLDQDVMSSPHEQCYADNEFEEAGDDDHLAGGSDHSEYDNEWNQRRLDDSQIRSDDDNIFVEQGFVQSEPSILASANDGFPDDWRLDEGPRHMFDREDEIDRLNDEQDHTDVAGGVEADVSEIVKKLPQEYFQAENDYEEDEAIEEIEQAVEGKDDNPHNDALTGLLNVRDEMNRLRAITRNGNNSNLPDKERHDSRTRYTTNAVDTAEERPLIAHKPQRWGEPAKKEPSYLERLTHADRFERSSVVAPPTDTPEKERVAFPERISPLHAVEPALLQPTATDDEHNDLVDNDVQVVKKSSGTTKVDNSKPNPFEFVEEPPHADTYIPNPTSEFDSNVSPPEIDQDQESYIAHGQGGRFDAAEKLYAVKEDLLIHGRYDKQQPPKHERYMKSQSPTRERYVHSGPVQQRYPPPTPMGATFANAKRTVEAEKSDHVPKNSSGDKSDNGENEDNSNQNSKQTQDQPMSNFVETMLPTSLDDLKDDTGPTPPAMNPPTIVPESSPPGKLSWACSIGITIIMFVSAMFCIAGIIYGANTVHDSNQYHMDLKARISKFEAGIAESHLKVLKLEEDYAIWSEYVRKLTEEDEANALTQLQVIQNEVQKWQQDMKEDLLQFRQALSVDSIEAAFANLSANSTKQGE